MFYRRTIIRIFALALLLSLLPLSHGKAEYSFQNAADGASVTPARFELQGLPGDTLNQSLRIANEGDELAIFTVTLENFVASGEEGAISFAQNNSYHPATLSRWVTFDNQSGTLAPKENRTVNFKVTIPRGTEPGGRYSAIVISMDHVNRPAGQSNASTRVVSLIMLSVIGDMRNSGRLESFTAMPQKGIGHPMDFEIRIRNQGKDHFQPSGMIVVSNAWGKKIDELPFSGDNILPDSTRKTVTSWQTKKLLFGYYTAAFVASYCSYPSPEKLSGTTSFWVIPAWFFWLVGLSLVMLLLRKKIRHT